MNDKPSQNTQPLSMPPAASSVSAAQCADLLNQLLWWPDSADQCIDINDTVLDGALWAPRETPADPFEEG